MIAMGCMFLGIYIVLAAWLVSSSLNRIAAAIERQSEGEEEDNNDEGDRG